MITIYRFNRSNLDNRMKLENIINLIKQRALEYEIKDISSKMLENGNTDTPIVEIEGKIYSYSDAIKIL